MQITAINNNLINNQKIRSNKNQTVTTTALNSELPSFIDAKSFVNMSFKAAIHDYITDDNWDGVKRELDNGVDINITDWNRSTPLMVAGYRDKKDIFYKLLEYPNVDVNAEDQFGDTALTRASRMGQDGFVTKLLEKPNIKVNTINNDGNTALLEAARYNRRNIAEKLLLRSDTDVNIQNGSGKTALMEAAAENVWAIAAMLIGHPDIDVNKQTRDGYTALMYAVLNTDQNITENLLRHSDIDVNLQDEYGRTALMIALSQGKYGAVEEILKHPDVDLNLKNEDGKTAWDFAWAPVLKDQLENYQRGIDRRENIIIANRTSRTSGVNARDDVGDTPLIRAIIDEQREEIERLLQNQNTDVNLANYDGVTPLIYASYYGINDVVEKLINHPDIDVNKQTKTGNTALIYASQAGKVQTVEKLLQHPDIDLNLRDEDGRTALDYAWKSDIKEKLENYQRGVDRRQNVISANRTSRTSNVNARDVAGNTALIRAIRANEEITLERLLQNQDVDVNFPNYEGITPLIYASFFGKHDAVEKLINHPDIDMNLQDRNGKTALIRASEAGNVRTVEKLLQHPYVDISIEDDDGYDASHYANDQIKAMINNYRPGVDRRENATGNNTTVSWADVNQKDEDGRTTLIRASIYGGIREVEELIQNPDTDINAQDNYNYTALIWACFKNQTDVVEKLMTRPDIDVNKTNFSNTTALMAACRKDDDEAVEMLLKHPDIDITKKDINGRRAYDYANPRAKEMIANYVRGTDKRRNLIQPRTQSQSDFDVNATDKDGCTALIRACGGKKLDEAKQLLQHPDIDVNIQDRCGNTALILSCYYGHTEIVEKLLQHPDIDINLKDCDGHTALYWARETNRSKITKMIQDHVPNVDRQKASKPVSGINARDEEGLTALYRAVKSDDLKTVERLLKRTDIDVNIPDNFGNTPLMYAANNGKVEIVKKLLERPDLDLTVKNNWGVTARECASIDTRFLISKYQKDMEQRQNKVNTLKNPVFDISKLSAEENIWSQEEISRKFLSYIKTKNYDDAEKMLEATPLIDLSGNNNEILSVVCTTGNVEFVKKVLEYQAKQPQMREEYDTKRNEFLENTIQTLSYDELKENPVALNTEDGFKVLMSKKEFNPNDIIGDKSMFEFACNIDSKGSMAKQILSKYDDVFTQKAKNTKNKELRQLIKEYETTGKYKIKFDNIKRNLANPETRDIAISQIKDFINSYEYKPDMTDTFGNSLLHIVSTTPDDSARGLIDKLIIKGIRLDSKNITNQNALISAIKAFRIAQNDEDKTKLLSNIKFLLDKGLDINEPDNNGQTAFHHACSTTSVALLSMVLAKEPNVFMKDKLGHKGSYYLSTPQMNEVYDNYVK